MNENNANLHRSIDCIAQELKGDNKEITEIVKPAPSCTNLAANCLTIAPEQQQKSPNLTEKQISPDKPSTSVTIVPSSSSSSGGGVSVSGGQRSNTPRASASSINSNTSRQMLTPAVDSGNLRGVGYVNDDKEQQPIAPQDAIAQHTEITKGADGSSSVSTGGGGSTDDDAKGNT